MIIVPKERHVVDPLVVLRAPPALVDLEVEGEVMEEGRATLTKGRHDII